MPTIRLTCSPDADDLFMARALLEGQLDTGPYRFEIATRETDGLNRLALGEGPDVLAISIAHYPHVAADWQLLPHGGSVGEGYGPVVVAPEPLSLEGLAGRRVAVPGLTTTATAVLGLMLPFEPVVVPITPYARIFEALRRGEADAGLVIHEGRLTYEDEGMVEVVELGRWWQQQTGLPLPLGGNVIRRSLGPQVIREVSALLRESIRHGLAHRDEAIRWLLARGGPLGTPERVGRYLDMYANHRTLDYGEDGRQAVRALLERLAEAGRVPSTEIDFAP